jgi:hypothetical protein
MLSSQATTLFVLFLEGQVSIKQCLLNDLTATKIMLMHESFTNHNFQANMYGMAG